MRKVISNIFLFKTIKDIGIYSKKKRILIIKSCRDAQFEKCVDVVCNTVKNSDLSLLIHSGKDIYKKYENDYEIIFFPEGKNFSPSLEVGGLINYLKKKNFDLIVVNINNPAFEDYERVFAFVFSFSKYSDIIAYGINGHFYYVNKKLLCSFYGLIRKFYILFIKLRFKLALANGK